HGSIWSARSSSNSGSWMWKKILKYRDKAKPLHRMEIRSGLGTSFWHDTWCSIGRLVDKLGPRGSIDMGIPSTSTVAAALSSHRRRRHRTNILNQIEDEMDALRLRSPNTGNDVSLWKQINGSFKSKFNSQQTWQAIRQTNPIYDWYKGVWFQHSTPKYSFIAWIAIRNRLATGDRLVKWNGAANGSCVFCQADVETRDHLFFSCPYSTQVWSALTREMLGLRYSTRWESLIPLITSSNSPHLHHFVLKYVFQLSIHSLWRERNGRRHGESTTPASTLSKLIDKNMRNR
ncbi:unnamed protein product, partial [Arabidopsis halleri]